ncbi:MAG: 30S ribosomal protein S8 [Patescibacteria group bacterium]
MDPISNMIVQIKNAGFSGHESIFVPFSKMKAGIAELLKKEGFVSRVESMSRKGKPALKINLIFNKRIPRVQGVKRLSKPSKRIYKKHTEIRPVKNGYGLLVISTSSGIMSGYEAKKAHLGGEVLFTIW